MMRLLALLALAVALALSGPAPRSAAAVSPHASTELVAESAGAAPGATVWVAVVQHLEKGWHTYWRNPGDAGEPTAIGWTLPPGWRADDIAWPAPRRLPVGPIMNYGYEGEVILPVPLQVPASARAGTVASLAAKVDYLVCAEVCVPGTASVSLNLPVVAGAPAADPVWGPRISATLAAAPKAGGLHAAWRRDGARLVLAVAGETLGGPQARDAYFYPYSGSLIDHAKPQMLDRGPQGLTLTLAVAPDLAKGSAAPPAKAEGVLVVDGRAFEISAGAGPSPPGASGLGAPTPAEGLAGLALAMASAFLGGVILNLMPCVFPVLSMKAASLAGHGAEAGAARAQGLAFVVGVLVSFLALAGALIAARAAGAAVGWGFQLQSPVAVGLLALVMLAAALNLSGLYEVGTSTQGLGASLAARGGLIGSAFTGALAVVVAAPCTAPFMGPALGFALTQSPPAALAVFFALGLGFAAPFALLSLSPALIRRLPRPGPWMDAFRKALAFPMYGAAAWLAWVLSRQSGPDGLARLLAAAVATGLAAWLFGVAQRLGAVRRGAGVLALSSGAVAASIGAILLVAGTASAPAAAAAAGPRPPSATLPAEAWSPERLAALRAAHTPVLVNFTAAWCVTCQVNERVAFSSREAAAAFRRDGATYLVGDWTNRDPQIEAALAEQGRIGVPLYLVYAADGRPPRVLPQLLTPGLVAEALDEAAAHRP